MVFVMLSTPSTKPNEVGLTVNVVGFTSKLPALFSRYNFPVTGLRTVGPMTPPVPIGPATMPYVSAFTAQTGSLPAPHCAAIHAWRRDVSTQPLTGQSPSETVVTGEFVKPEKTSTSPAYSPGSHTLCVLESTLYAPPNPPTIVMIEKLEPLMTV